MTKNTKSKAVETTLPENSFIKLELNKVASLKKEFKAEQAKFVKTAVNPDLTDVELLVFLSFANKLELNPFLGEIIPIVYGKNTKDRRVNYIITRNGKRVVAGRTGQLEKLTSRAIYYSGNDECAPWTEGATLWGAEATVTRGGVDFTVSVPFKEYNTGYNVWKSKPETMIKKVAESQALSAAFPEILGAAYDESEADSMNNRKVIEVPNGDAPATMEQLQSLNEMGVDFSSTITRKEATELLTSKKRKE